MIPAHAKIRVGAWIKFLDEGEGSHQSSDLPFEPPEMGLTLFSEDAAQEKLQTETQFSSPKQVKYNHN